MNTAVRAVAGILLVVAAASLSACGDARPSSDASILNSMRTTKEQQRQIYECVKQEGWDVTFDEASGAILTSIPDSQNDAFDAALEKCHKKLGLNFDTPPTEEQMKVVYRWSKAVAACLKENGWSVPETPSFATFTDTYDTDPWIPWISIPGPEMSSAEKKCPVISEGSGLAK